MSAQKSCTGMSGHNSLFLPLELPFYLRKARKPALSAHSVKNGQVAI